MSLNQPCQNNEGIVNNFQINFNRNLNRKSPTTHFMNALMSDSNVIKMM